MKRERKTKSMLTESEWPMNSAMNNSLTIIPPATTPCKLPAPNLPGKQSADTLPLGVDVTESTGRARYVTVYQEPLEELSDVFISLCQRLPDNIYYLHIRRFTPEQRPLKDGIHLKPDSAKDILYTPDIQKRDASYCLDINMELRLYSNSAGVLLVKNPTGRFVSGINLTFEEYEGLKKHLVKLVEEKLL